MQSAFWGAFKADFGWDAHHFLLRIANDPPLPLLVLVRRIAPFGRLAYIPHGPQVLPEHYRHTSLLATIGERLRRLLPRDCLFIRFDLPWHTADLTATTIPADTSPTDTIPADTSPAATSPTDTSNASAGALDSLPALDGLRPAGVEVQPATTVLVDLRPDDEQRLAAMHPKTRYNIGLAARRGVSVRAVDPDAEASALERWYALYQQTAERDKIVIHSWRYYRTLFAYADQAALAAGRAPRLLLLFGEHEDDLLAGIIVALWNNQATYLYGASAGHKRNLMAGYALQWHAMQIACAAGCTQYDLFGIPANRDPRQPMAGLYRFKTGFGGRIVHRLGAWDYRWRPTPLWSMAESLRRIYFKRLRRATG